MKKKYQVLAGLAVIVAVALWLAGCDHYVCTSGATFGGSCTASGSGLGTTGPGGSATAAFIFAVDTTGGTSGTATNGTIDGFTLNTTTNSLAPTANYTAPTVPLGDPGVGMVVAQGKYLYAAFQSTRQIFGWTISSTGTLTSVSNNTPYSAAFLASASTVVGQQTMITNPAGTLLFIAVPGSSEIVVYSIGGGGALTLASTMPTPGFAPLNLTTDGLGKYLYATEGNSVSHTPNTGIAEFSINSTNGTLTSIGTLATPMWQVAGEPTGKFLIGTTGESQLVNGTTDDDHLYVFSIASAGTPGALTELSPSTSTGTDSPFTIAVQPNANGNLVYSFGIADAQFGGFNPIEGFSINSSGTLTGLQGSPFAIQQGYWGQFDQTGAFLLEYGATVNVSTGIVTTQINAMSVGSGGTLNVISPLTLVTQGYWAVTDAP
ncbi:MAG TPA: beta-propeller fold lactonase family protein [Candidatus Sulfotelmatobacter sp.]|nr:beta-propeller fold lactonase family protein [Candidatus Sulfotelmatobacter sp.]